MTWVLAPIVERDTGLTPGQLRGMAQRGKIRRGEHYAVIDRKTVYNVEALQQWLDSEACAQAELRTPETTRAGQNLEKVQNTPTPESQPPAPPR